MTDDVGYAGYEDRTMPIICYALYLLAFATGGLTAIVGVIIAYMQRSTAGPVMHSHYTFLIRTFWLAPEHRRARTWVEHRDINEVMLATSLLPEAYLKLSPRSAGRGDL